MDQSASERTVTFEETSDSGNLICLFCCIFTELSALLNEDIVKLFPPFTCTRTACRSAPIDQFKFAWHVTKPVKGNRGCFRKFRSKFKWQGSFRFLLTGIFGITSGGGPLISVEIFRQTGSLPSLGNSEKE